MPLKNSQYDAIMRDYNRKQQMHRHELEAHKEELYNKIPRLKDIDREITATSLQAIRRKLNHAGTRAQSPYQQEIANLGAERRKLLLTNGYPDDYLSMQYDCPLCHDTGYIEGKKCRCFKKAAVDLLYTQSNLQDILKRENFDSFSFDYYSDTIKNESTDMTALDTAKTAVEKAHLFVDTFDKDFQNLFLYGNTGVGKTFLSHCIAKELIDQAYSVLYYSASSFFDTLAKIAFKKSKAEEDAPMEQEEDIKNCDLLIIDDLGTEFQNRFVETQLFDYINERLIRRKPTIISTNLSLDQIKDTYSERVFSRIMGNYTIIKLIGNDIRIQKRLLGGKQ